MVTVATSDTTMADQDQWIPRAAALWLSCPLVPFAPPGADGPAVLLGALGLTDTAPPAVIIFGSASTESMICAGSLSQRYHPGWRRDSTHVHDSILKRNVRPEDHGLLPAQTDIRAVRSSLHIQHRLRGHFESSKFAGTSPGIRVQSVVCRILTKNQSAYFALTADAHSHGYPGSSRRFRSVSSPSTRPLSMRRRREQRL